MSQSNYDKNPLISIKGFENEIFTAAGIRTELAQRMNLDKNIVVVDCYPGVSLSSLEELFHDLSFDLVFCSDDCAYEPEKLDDLWEENLTDDRVFGIMTHGTLEQCFYPEKLQQLRTAIDALPSGNVLLYGVGAALVTTGTLCILAELSRWEIQLRYRAGMDNWRTAKKDLPTLSKYKRGYFIEWRLADRHKRGLYSSIDYYLDMNQNAYPVMVTQNAYFFALEQTSQRPFRLVPYFDPGIWGGNWMEKNFDLPSDCLNYAWSFDGVPEENSLKFDFGSAILETPAINLVFTHPKELLGDRVHARFGTEFPIRFDFLDTMGGQNLSLQVHPLTEYIQEHFHMHYTQDESYYIMDAGENACVYLGVKEGVNKEEMMDNLVAAQNGSELFRDEDFINRFPVKKHDHVLIPAGTIHCSGKNTVVLEISATPYIFTFKLWDWNRLGLDGLPRPVHLAHGFANIQWNRDTSWVRQELLHQETVVYEAQNILIERTGLHNREFIDTYRLNFSVPVPVQPNGSVHMLNLVEGTEITVHSANNTFADFVVHYGETFIVPEAAGAYKLFPSPDSADTSRVILACVRN